MLTVMKAKQARVECIQKIFLPRKSFFPSFCGVGPLVTENQTLWLPKSFSNPVQTCNKPIQGYLVELANSQNQLSFTSLNLVNPPRCLVCPRYNLCRYMITLWEATRTMKNNNLSIAMLYDWRVHRILQPHPAYV